MVVSVPRLLCLFRLMVHSFTAFWLVCFSPRLAVSATAGLYFAVGGACCFVLLVSMFVVV